ncbi:CTP synthase C-terminal region-related (seleno)protein [Streptomyces litchfieldiae]|uniref:CTP synthase (glutamine hydrolyzing) n=1 Tax=Streptomyces litchfieldiae TaxID=3075543 RepID=A0ABU2MJV8_9ACTN|nr:gamma-glutamyl-gamma-aminobutyrate hydrolase family protein [Streptomyces sp. DSM 44938]MDT0341653.1 gamma-glutamyl-gamma-aminobutyrate hydrolase family protein [Streptomyces sp. DSM 44938]
MTSAHIPRLAVVGDRSPAVRSHLRIPGLLHALAEHEGLPLDTYWIPTGDAERPGALDGFDAIWLVPGSPYASEAGALAAVRTARERGVPFLGTCAGFQHALIEYARAVCGLTTAGHVENEPGTTEPLITPVACSLVGHEGEVRIEPGSLAERVFGAERSVERYHCEFELNPDYLPVLRAQGLAFTGADTAGAVRVAELPGHPFFLATLFQPELAGDGSRPHPVITALARAAAGHPAAAAATPATR